MTELISPHEAIRALLAVYCELMDAADWTALGELFGDAELVSEAGDVFAAGTAGVQRMYERGTRLYDGSPRTRHITANSVIDVDGDHASVRSSYVVFQQAEDMSLQPIISGRYRDAFARDERGWRFARRQFIVDHVGDLSRHLTYEVPAR